MRRRLRGYAAVVTVAALCSLQAARADYEEGPEVGFMIGVVSAEKELTFDSGSTSPAVGMRVGRVFSDHWGWYLDGIFSQVDSAFGDADTVIGRTGFDYMFTPASRQRFFVNLGVGWMAVNYDKVAFADHHNPIGSIGFGQRIHLRDDRRLRWEIRADRTLDDARLTDNATQALVPNY